ncbi:MAG: 6-carboxytetrahydropterin synthase [Ignavibacteria bacterium]|nr:6-carboxytetrahydropterin synthase [Ignavibacteria bacterium]
MIFLTRREHFSASHRLYNPKFSDEKNFEIFGKCSNPNGHGHNYYVEVTVCGELSDDTGFLINLEILKKILQISFIDKVDHKNLNSDVEFLSNINPTSENIAIACWNQIESQIQKYCKLYSVKLYETEKNFVEFRGNIK